MKSNLPIYVLVIFLICFEGCKDSKDKVDISVAREHTSKYDTVIESAQSEVVQKNDIKDFVPKGFKIFEKVYGDLNKDGQEDCIIIIKGTDKNQFVEVENRGILDRNRRGLIILFKNKDFYSLVLKNETCFSSENEEGGNYYAPELLVGIEKNRLFVHYAHGRYGYWRYTFQYRNSDFYLIGYDSNDNFGPRVNSETSINYITGRKQVKENVNQQAESGEEIFEETWTDLKTKELVKLSQIRDFDEYEN